MVEESWNQLWAPTGSKAHMKFVCLLSNAQVGETSPVLWHSALDPTVALLFMNEFQILIIKWGGKRKDICTYMILLSSGDIFEIVLKIKILGILFCLL